MLPSYPVNNCILIQNMIQAVCHLIIFRKNNVGSFIHIHMTIKLSLENTVFKLPLGASEYFFTSWILVSKHRIGIKPSLCLYDIKDT